MSDLSNQTPADTYKGLLQVNDYTDGVNATAKYIQDGEGTDSALAISTDKVGIGTTSPDAKLEVIADSVPANTPAVWLHNADNQTDRDGVVISSTNNGSDAEVLHVRSNNTTYNGGTSHLLVRGDGNVGIGTASPDYKLDVKEAANSTYAAKIFNGGGDSYGLLVKTNSGTIEDFPILDLENTAGNVFRVQANGNVGIGTTSPSEKLHVSGNAIITGDLSVSGTTTTINTETLSVEDHQIILGTLSSGTPTDLTADDGGIVLKGDTDKTILWSNDTDAWRCNQNFIADGNVGIGTTDPGAELEVNGQIISNRRFMSEDSLELVSDYNDNSSTSIISFKIDGQGAGNEKMRIDSDGNVGIGTTSPEARLEVKSVSNLHMRVGNKDQETSPIIRFQGQSSGGQSHYADIQLDAETGTLLLKDPGTSSPSIGQSPVAIDSDGNVGIGTASPRKILHIAQAVNGDSEVTFHNNDTTSASSLQTKSLSFAFAQTGSSATRSVGAMVRGGKEKEWTSSSLSQDGYLSLHTTKGTSIQERMRIDSDGNVGIGTTSPGAKLEVKGTQNWIASTGDRMAYLSPTVDGGALIILDSSSNEGLRLEARPGEDSFINNGGNVGIGTTSPDAQLHLKHNNGQAVDDFTTLKLEAPDPTILLSDSTNSPGDMSIMWQAAATSTGIEGSGGLRFYRDGDVNDVQFMISTAGNVGIGTTSPDANVLLHVQGEVGTTNGEEADPTHTFYSDPDTGMFRAAVDTLAFSTGGVEKMRIDSSGNVGIGTTSPGKRLEVNLTDNTAYTDGVTSNSLKLRNLSQSADSYSGIELTAGQTSGGGANIARIYAVKESVLNTATSLAFTTRKSNETVSEAMRIDSDGNVGIGTTSPGAPLHIKTSNTTDTLLLEATSGVGLNAPDLVLYRNSASPAADDKIGVVKFRGQHSVGGTKDYANIQGIIVDPTNTAEDSKIDFEVRTGGALESRMEVGPDKVEVSSTTGGVVMPRMTTTQRNAIASPINGEMVYDTDLNKFYGYANNAWTPLH